MKQNIVDLNAAINLANYSPTSKLEGSKACGERVVARQSTSKKQEINVCFGNIASKSKNL